MGKPICKGNYPLPIAICRHTTRDSRLISFEVFTQADDPHAVELPQIEQRLMSGNDRVHMAGEGAFKHAIIGFVFHDAQLLPRPHSDSKLGKEQRNAGKLFLVPRELAREDAQQFVEDRFGEEELVPLFNDSEESRFPPAARKYQRRYQHVGIEDDLHAVR